MCNVQCSEENVEKSRQGRRVEDDELVVEEWKRSSQEKGRVRSCLNLVTLARADGDGDAAVDVFTREL